MYVLQFLYLTSWPVSSEMNMGLLMHASSSIVDYFNVFDVHSWWEQVVSLGLCIYYK